VGRKDVTLIGGLLEISGTVSDDLSAVVRADAEFCVLEGGNVTIGPGQGLILESDAGKVGFDGDTGGAASLTIAGTLGFVAGPSGFTTIETFHSGKYGLDTFNRPKSPNVVSSVVLEAGAEIIFDKGNLSPGTYDLIRANSLIDNGATLPAGVSINGNTLRAII